MRAPTPTRESTTCTITWLLRLTTTPYVYIFQLTEGGSKRRRRRDKASQEESNSGNHCFSAVSMTIGAERRQVMVAIAEGVMFSRCLFSTTTVIDDRHGHVPLASTKRTHHHTRKSEAVEDRERLRHINERHTYVIFTTTSPMTGLTIVETSRTRQTTRPL